MRTSEFVPPSRPLILLSAASQQARALRIEAERCFRLAEGVGSFELADELEALGRAFEAEAELAAAA